MKHRSEGDDLLDTLLALRAVARAGRSEPDTVQVVSFAEAITSATVPSARSFP